MLRQPGECAEADHLQPVVMRSSWGPYRSAETSDDTDGKTIRAKYRSRELRRPQAVLNGLDDRLRTQQGNAGTRRLLHIEGLGGNDDEVAGSDAVRRCRSTNRHRAIAARTFATQALGSHRLGRVRPTR